MCSINAVSLVFQLLLPLNSRLPNLTLPFPAIVLDTFLPSQASFLPSMPGSQASVKLSCYLLHLPISVTLALSSALTVHLIHRTEDTLASATNNE
jgi:hypothetical protein